MFVAMALAEKLHHSAPRKPTMARARGGERRVAQRHGPDDWAASTVYFSLDDDGDVLAGRRDGLYEVRPQDRFRRRTVEQNVDAVTFPSLDVPEPQMEYRLVEVLQKIDTRTSHQVIDVPRSFLTVFHSALWRVVVRRWRNSWWKCRRSQGTHLRFSPRRSFRGGSFLAFSRDRVQQRLGPGFWRRSLTIRVSGGGGRRGEGLQGSRARQNSTAADVEQIVDTPARRGLTDSPRPWFHSFLIESIA